MKTKLSTSLQSRYLQLIFMIILAGMATSCSTKVLFPTSSVVPAAVATATIKKDKNSNYSINLTVKNIASPEKLQPSHTLYLVWAETSEAGLINLGQLKVSKKLSGKLETVNAYKPITIIVTAEDNPSAIAPGRQVVLRTDIEW